MKIAFLFVQNISISGKHFLSNTDSTLVYAKESRDKIYPCLFDILKCNCSIFDFSTRVNLSSTSIFNHVKKALNCVNSNKVQ